MIEKKKKNSWLRNFISDFTADTSKSGKRNVVGPVLKGVIGAFKNLPANLKGLSK
jgi:hypothetical protein